MQFIQALTYLLQTAEFSYSVIHFYGQTLPYQLIFFLYQQLKRTHSIISYNASEVSLSQLKLLIATEFLGQSSLVWLTHVEDLTPAKQEALHQLLANYEGPHKIFFYSNHELLIKKKSTIDIFIPLAADVLMLGTLSSLILKEKKNKYEPFLLGVTKKYQQFAWDEAYNLIMYAQLLGKTDERFNSLWLPKLVESPHSLFILSQHFFSFKDKDFFHVWHSLINYYSEQFWIFYWSDQLTRAAAYCYYINKKDSVSAKKIGYRLPFSFIQKDWRNHTSSSLAQAHNYIYKIDYRFKNGNDGWLGLELFYLKFFAKN